MSELTNNYLEIDVMCVLSLLILAHMSLRNVFYTSEMKKQFFFAACAAILVVLAELGSVLFESRILRSDAHAFLANVLGFSLSPFIPVILSKAFSAERRNSRMALTIPAWCSLAAAISSPWTGLIFTIDNHQYLRGPWFGLYIAAYLCAYFILIAESFRAMKLYQGHIKSTFIALLVFTFIGTLVQIALPDVHTSWLCVTLSLILYYAYFCELSETQDTLTGLLNRSVYEQYTKRFNQTASGSVLMFDLDHFKQINDRYGHQWGDSCLQAIGALIKECFSHLGLCYRVGGDEFCVICRATDERHLNDALGLFHEKIDKIRKNSAVETEFPLVSTGYSSFSHSGKGYAAAVKEADTQMYQFKQKRKQSL